MKDFIVVSLGGSLVSTDVGPNVSYIKKICELFKNEIRRGSRLAIIVGGGKISRQYTDAAGRASKAVSERDLHWIGIYATRINAALLKALMKPYTPDDVLLPFGAYKTLAMKYKCVIGGGTEPGGSSDLASIAWAKALGAKRVVNCTNVDYVYTADPRKVAGAKPLPNLSWNAYIKMVGSKFTPGASWPFDPLASIEAKRRGIIVNIVNGSNLKEVSKALRGEKFKGSVLA